MQSWEDCGLTPLAETRRMVSFRAKDCWLQLRILPVGRSTTQNQFTDNLFVEVLV
jgi:hypothetical protein